ncbi:MAG: hypothetical protein H6Q04_2282 [Acidobacteria bacterium]|jgi:hypothetical protein|nr:hypothetical protein [Acidobacteriota bacterium]
MNTRLEEYYAYLLRLWLVKWDGNRAWRVSLENIHTGESHKFASLPALIEFLMEVEKTGKQETHKD